MRKRTIIVVLSFVLITLSHAQKLDWALAGQNIGLKWQYGGLTKNNCIVVGGESSEMNNTFGEIVLFDGKGKPVPELYFSDQEIVVCFSSTGQYLWHQSFSSDYSRLQGIACDQSGNTYLLMYVPENSVPENDEYMEEEYDENGELIQPEEKVEEEVVEEISMGMIPELDQRTGIQTGYYILKLNSRGQVINTFRTGIDERAEPEIYELKCHPQGGFVVGGFASPGFVSETLKLKAGKSGADFVLRLDSLGKPLWGDAISYFGNSCCTFSPFTQRISIAPDGSVIVCGIYFDGAEFGKKIFKLAPYSYNEKGNNSSDIDETYLASYSPDGELNWVTTSVSRGRPCGLAVSKDHIAIAFRSYYPKAFGIKLDTSVKVYSSLILFDRKGKLKKLINPNAEFSDMTFDAKGDLYVLGNREGYYKNRWFYAKDSLPAREDTYVAVFDSDFKMKSLGSFNAPVSTSNEILRMFLGTDNRCYIFGYLFCGFKTELKRFEPAFNSAEIYGGGPFACCLKPK